eukprot:m.107762 g.107762  ORF g.107762 m.107762 type:complete len:78 (+) comp9180_c1_seq1:1706-1939(+)
MGILLKALNVISQLLLFCIIIIIFYGYNPKEIVQVTNINKYSKMDEMIRVLIDFQYGIKPKKSLCFLSSFTCGQRAF